jgi:hypothetical protein
MHFSGVASFFNGGLLNELICIFLRVASFSSEDFRMSPFAFSGVASFFIEGLLNESLCVFRGLPHFYRRSFE